MQAVSREQIAYDLSMFDEGRMRPGTKETAIKKEHHSVGLTRVAIFVVVVSTLAAILLSYAQLNEINDEVATMKSELSYLREEERRMAVLLDEKTSLKKVDEYARTVLGMIDVSPSQVQYISLNNQDKVQVFKTAPKVDLAAITDSVVKSFNAVMEYLK